MTQIRDQTKLDRTESVQPTKAEQNSDLRFCSIPDIIKEARAASGGVRAISDNIEKGDLQPASTFSQIYLEVSLPESTETSNYAFPTLKILAFLEPIFLQV